jgi:hypothetical protein
MRRLNNGQTGESGGVLPQTNRNIFLRTTIDLAAAELAQ